MRDARFHEFLSAERESIAGVKALSLCLGVEREAVKAVSAAFFEHEAEQRVAESLAPPSAANGQTLKDGPVARVADSSAGHGFAVHNAQDVQGRVVVFIHFKGIGDALLFHEDNGPDHENLTQVLRSVNAFEHVYARKSAATGCGALCYCFVLAGVVWFVPVCGAVSLVWFVWAVEKRGFRLAARLWM